MNNHYTTTKDDCHDISHRCPASPNEEGNRPKPIRNIGLDNSDRFYNYNSSEGGIPPSPPIDTLSVAPIVCASNSPKKRKKVPTPPTSLVWTPIPVITWLFPFVGHMGITTSRGVIYDFASPYHVTVDDMAFGGEPVKYYSFEPGPTNYGAWDEAIGRASREYNDYHVHNLFLDNCHSHVALCLNTFKGSAAPDSWNVPKLALLMFFRGRYLTWRGRVLTWLPFCLILTFVAIMVYVSRTFMV